MPSLASCRQLVYHIKREWNSLPKRYMLADMKPIPYTDVEINRICGIDEAGRGPLVGPVTAAAVILPVSFPTEQLNDSKKLSQQERIRVAREIVLHAIDWALGWSWPGEIDLVNIHHASLLAMKRAYLGIDTEVSLVVVDGKFTPRISTPVTSIVGGDAQIPSVMAASILAKTVRDSWMIGYSKVEPEYLFEKHKGYPTKEHRNRIQMLGLSQIHRSSFTVS